MSGVSIGTTTGWPGVSTTWSAISPIVRPSTLRAPACTRSRLRSSRATSATPPASKMSVATNLPPGLRLATIGVRAAISSNSSIENGMSSSRAIASRCSTPFVDPPVAATDAAAFSIASRVTMCDGRTSSRSSRIASRPHSSAASPLPRLSAGIPFSPAGLMPRKSSAVDMVLAVNWPPQAPAPGHAADSTSCSSAASIVPAAYAPTASKTSWMVMSRPRNVPGAIEPL